MAKMMSKSAVLAHLAGKTNLSKRQIGEVFDSRDEIGSIESVKAVAEVYTPVAGEVVEVNGAVVDDPEVLNEDVHGEGWLVKIRYSSAGDLEGLMNADQYAAYTEKGET